MKKAVVFDFDGVIINSSEVQRQALMESYKLVVGDGEPSFEQFLSHSGDSLENIFRKMLLPVEMVGPYQRISREHMDAIRVYAGMKELLMQLNANGYSCALCTGKDRSRTLEILNKLGLFSCFSVVVCSDDVTHPKPSAESLNLVLRQLAVSRDQAVMVGDARNDIICARNAGMKVIAVSWGDVPLSQLLMEHPDYIANDVNELADHIIDCLQLQFTMNS